MENIEKKLNLNEKDNKMEIEKEEVTGEDVQTKDVNNETIQVEIITEGKATIRLCNDDKSFFAFYNPAQVIQIR